VKRIGIVLAMMASGCSQLTVPELDETHERLVVATGYFISANDAKHPRKPLSESESELESVSDCFCGPPAVARFAVTEIISGTLDAAAQIRLFNTRGVFNKELRLGPAHPQVVVIRTDGRSHFVSALFPFDMARTTTKEWALPIGLRDLPDTLPCGASKLVHPLDFQPPGPRLRLDSYEATGYDVSESSFGESADGEFLYAHQGILLRDLRKLAPRPPEALYEANCEDAS
jgi:hypothetical protein